VEENANPSPAVAGELRPGPAEAVGVLDAAAAQRVLAVDVDNVRRKAEQCKPLSKYERTLIQEEARRTERARATAAPAPSPAAGTAAETLRLASGLAAKRLCELTGLTDRRHRQLADAGYFPSPQNGEYDFERTIEGLFRYFREQIAKKSNSLAKEQLRLTKAKREKTEAEAGKLRGLLIEKDEVGPALRNLAAHQRATLQHKIERELAPNLAGRPVGEIMTLCQRAVDDVCEVFEKGIAEWCQVDGGQAGQDSEGAP